MFIEILFKILLFKGGVLIYAEHCTSLICYNVQHCKTERKHKYTFDSDLRQLSVIFVMLFMFI